MLINPDPRELTDGSEFGFMLEVQFHGNAFRYLAIDRIPSMPRGALADPESPYGREVNRSVDTLEKLADRQCLALLGEPGMGKSTVIKGHAET